ncbi:MAG: SpoIIE family protein phosphatase [Dehalococcoidia bacterium]
MGLTENLAVAAAGRPHPNEPVSGDAWSVRWEAGVCRLAVVDGAGHGPAAEMAAAIAIGTFEESLGLAPAEVLRICHGRLRGTRGAVMAVAVIDPAGNTLEVAGVGNIEARLLMDGREQHPISQRGMLGSNIPTIRPFTTSLPREWLLVLHTDGIRTRWKLEEASEDALPVNRLAERILERHARTDDDACVVVVRPAASEGK